jgi:hypothetical protein
VEPITSFLKRESAHDSNTGEMASTLAKPVEGKEEVLKRIPGTLLSGCPMFDLWVPEPVALARQKPVALRFRIWTRLPTSLAVRKDKQRSRFPATCRQEDPRAHVFRIKLRLIVILVAFKGATPIRGNAGVGGLNTDIDGVTWDDNHTV